MTTQAKNLPFREDILVIIHKLVDLPISHGLISRMKQLEHLLTHFEAREFTYYNHRDLIVSRNCMLALWMYLLKNIDQISVLKYQDIAYRMIRALMMRREFYLSNLGYSAESGDPFENQTEDELKCCRVYRKLLVETFLYAADILPLCLADTSTHTSKSAEKALKEKAVEKSLQTARNGGWRIATDSSETDRPHCVRRFCTMVFAFAFLRIPAIQGPVIESLTWRLMNQQQLMEATQQKTNHGTNDDNKEPPEKALNEAIRMPRARKLVDLHAKFINSNPHLFAWSALASPDDKTKAVPEDPSWLYSLGRDGLIFIDFFLQLTRQVLEIATEPGSGTTNIGEKKEIPWLSLPGYSLFVELYAPLLGFSLVEAVDKAAGLAKRSLATAPVVGEVDTTSTQLPPAPRTLSASAQNWVDKFAPQDQPRPSSYQISQIMEMGFTHSQSIVALMHTATVSSAFLDNPNSPKYVMDVSRAVEFALVEDVRKLVDDLGGEDEVTANYNQSKHLKLQSSTAPSDVDSKPPPIEDDTPDLIDFTGMMEDSEETSSATLGVGSLLISTNEEAFDLAPVGDDEETVLYKQKVQEMEMAKASAVNDEDFLRAAQIKQFILDLTTAENLRLQLKDQFRQEEENHRNQLLQEESLLFGQTAPPDLIQQPSNAAVESMPDDGWFADGMLGSTNELIKALHEEAQHCDPNASKDVTSAEVLIEGVEVENTSNSLTSPYHVPTEQERSEEWANRARSAALSYLGADDSELNNRRKTLGDAVVVGSGVILGNPHLLGLHLTSLLCSLHRLPKETSLVATPFTLEVAARWFHQSSTRKLAMLGTIQVKIWVLPMTEIEVCAFIDEFEKLLVVSLEQDEKERAGGAATKALKQIITFLYHNIDLIHGPPRYKLMKMLLDVAFMRMFINKSKEVMYGFHLLVVYKLLRFHRHHAGSANDLDLLTSIGSKLLSIEQSRIMETLQEVANRKTLAADPWKGMVEVEELDIDRALQSHVHVLIDLVREAPNKEKTMDQAEVKEDTNPADLLVPVENLLLVESDEGQQQPLPPPPTSPPVQPRDHVAVPVEGLSLVEAALANYSRNLWDYYLSGLKQRNDAALSVFAPPLVFAKAHSAFSPPRRIFVPGVSAPLTGGFTVYNPPDFSDNSPNNGLGRKIQDTPYSDSRGDTTK